MKHSRKYSRTFRPKEPTLDVPFTSDLQKDMAEPTTKDLPSIGKVRESEGFLQRLIRRSMFWSPAYLGESWNEYIPLAFWAVDVLRPKLIVEVGSVSPVSYFAFCQAVNRLGIDSQCIAIDTSGSVIESVSDESRLEFLRFYNSQTYGAFSSVTSHQWENTAKLFKFGAIDLLHLNLPKTADAEFVENFDNWLHLLSDNGLMMISGTGIQAKRPKLGELLSSLPDRFSVFNFTHGLGLTLISPCERLVEPFTTLFNAGNVPGEAQVIREIFSRVGQGCSDAHALSSERRSGAQQLHKDLERKSARIDDLEKEKAKLSKKVDELTSIRAKSDSTNRKAIEEASAVFKSEIKELRKHAAVMEEELLQSRKAASNHVSEIDALKTELSQAESTRERQTRELATLTELLLHTEEKLEKIQSEFSALVSSTKKNLGELQSQPSEIKKAGRLPGLLRVFGGNSKVSRRDGGAKFLQAQKLLLDSALFDEQWYLGKYPEVAASNMSPIEHYLTVGAALGYDPSTNFDTSYYLDKYNDVAISGMNPLVHYLRFGISENRKPKAS